MTTMDDPSQFYAPQPSEARRVVLDRFVEEYVKDFNPVAAAVRVGFNLTYAQAYVPEFMGTPYVARKILEYKNQPKPDEAERTAQIKARIEAVYAKNMECGNPKVEVTAATKLGEMHGLMQAPDKSGEHLKEVVNFFQEVAKAVPD